MCGALRSSQLQCHLPLQAPLLLMNLSASSARGSDSGSPTCAHGKCVWMCKALLCGGTSVVCKGQGETRHAGLPTIHWRDLLFRISSAPTTLAKSFWRVSLSWLSHFFPMIFFFLLRRNEAIPIIILWWWWKLQSSLFLIDSLGGLG